MPPTTRPWTPELLGELRASLEKELDGHGPLPVSKEDLVAEVMLRLYVASDRQVVECPAAYARAILLNLVRDHLRELERARKAMVALATDAGRRGTGRDNGADLEDGDLVRHLIEHSGLTAVQRTVIERLYLHGLTTCDLAREQGKNPGTVQRHHDRALEKLSRCAARMGIQR